MKHTDIDALRACKTFPQLAAYLRDELEWPIEAGKTEDITFEYEPSELGIEAKAAVRIKEIKQLRPFAGGQPWGIFFINFEKKRLPVVVMRLILRALVLKKRASANKADRQAWQPSDLLFISAYGEDTDRSITFAHFVENPGSNSAELRVLGWDDDDTPLHMDYVARMLQEKLHWDDKLAAHPDTWRQQWSDAFLIRHRFVITKSEELAVALADLARRIRSRVSTVLRAEDGFGQMRKLQSAFRTALIHDLDDDGFADMFAQTVTYGLFSLACRRTIPGEGTAFAKDDLTTYFTSPFLKEMLGVFLGIKSRKGKIDFDQLGVSDVTDLLTSPDTHMEVVLADFNNKTRGEDPVIHFYELFLTAYNKQLTIQRGVFYTPQPVVSYIVRSVHELLQTEFGLEDGLASTVTWSEMIKKNPKLTLPPLTDESGEKRKISKDEPFVQILDPATGTATFLVEVIDVIHKTMVSKWKKLGKSAAEISRLWNDYVPKHLLTRVYGYELMMAPYAIAHMKVGLKLSETGYFFATEVPLCIYLTNALEPKVQQLPTIGFEALAHEAAAVNQVKWYKRFTVVIGNPPYSQMSQNLGERERALITPYRFVDAVKIQERGAITFERNLQDDYIKFIRLSEIQVVTAGVGVCGIITNHAFLANITLRGMRFHLLSSFNRISITDLHGNSKIHEKSPDESPDENVFDIQQGVAVSLMTRNGAANSNTVTFAELWGSRKSKYEQLSASSKMLHAVSLLPQSPNYLFVTRDNDLAKEYEAWPKLNEVMPLYGSAITTARDNVVVGFDDNEIIKRVKVFQDAAISDARVLSVLDIGESAIWSISDARKGLRGVSLKKHLTDVSYRPFDSRRLFYHDALISSPRHPTMRHMSADNSIALAVCRQQCVPGFHHVFISTTIFDEGLVSNRSREKTVAFPLYLTEDEEGQLFKSAVGNPNLHPKFLSQLLRQLDLKSKSNGKGSLTPRGTLGADDTLHYIYAVLHSFSYRRRYEDLLKTDFPRLPLTSSLDLFRSLAKLGGELVALHLMESPTLKKPVTKFIGTAKEVTKVGWTDDTVWIDAGGKKGANTLGTSGFRGVPSEVWNFHIGGYQVCEKWLKDRKGRTLADDDIAHYHKIVVALSETIRLMSEIDEVIDSHGGWPDAFTVNTTKN